MNRRLRTYAYASLLASIPATGWTIDRWEASTLGNDEPFFTLNELVHGSSSRGTTWSPIRRG